jgi:hypothetical protein
MRITETARAEISELLKQHSGMVLHVMLRGYG